MQLVVAVVVVTVETIELRRTGHGRLMQTIVKVRKREKTRRYYIKVLSIHLDVSHSAGSGAKPRRPTLKSNSKYCTYPHTCDEFKFKQKRR